MKKVSFFPVLFMQSSSVLVKNGYLANPQHQCSTLASMLCPDGIPYRHTILSIVLFGNDFIEKLAQKWAMETSTSPDS